MSESPTNKPEDLTIIFQHISEGRVIEAEKICRQILTQQPDNARIHNLLGVALQRQRLQSEALACYQQAIALDPNYAQAYNNLGIFFWELHKFPEAFSYYQQALALKPDLFEVYNNIGNIYYELDKWEDALACYKQALALNPNYVESYNNIGNVFKEQGKHQEALTCYKRVLTLNPNSAEAYNNIGVVFLDQNQLETAKAYFLQALTLAPNSPDIHNNLGTIFVEQRCVESAIAYYEQGIAIGPNYPKVHPNLGQALLLTGDFSRGFAEYEWRRQAKDFKLQFGCFLEEQLWDGSNLEGRTILLLAEQGLGDTIHFIRYAPLVQNCGGRVILICPPELIRLLKTVPGIVQIIDQVTELPEFDVHAPLMSLPKILGTTLETIPTQIPYISVPTECEKLTLPIPPNTKLKVGIVWASGYKDKPRWALRLYKNRSCPLAIFVENLLPIPGISLYSLQIGRDRCALEEYREEPRIQDLSNNIHDFADTAAAIAQLDLIITVDTAVAHLAGAMGKPVWVLLPFAHDWRWLIDRSDSPWYATMRLFRQSQSGDWQSVFAQVVKALNNLN